ncbi:unnamed protein product [Dicrocoelium dendriticum]|nr:unnamed protein product [Dicrocoelium dendriticum]
MLLVHFDCSILWVSDQSILTDTFTIDAVYLGGPYTGMPEFKNWSVNLGRKNRALKLWMVLRNCGLEKIRILMRKHHQLANLFAHLIESDTRFQLVNDVRLGLVCFNLKTGNKANKELFRMLRHERQLFLTSGSLPTHIGEKDASEFLRFVSNHQATLEDIERAVRIITNTATRVLQQSPK